MDSQNLTLTPSIKIWGEKLYIPQTLSYETLNYLHLQICYIAADQVSNYSCTPVIVYFKNWKKKLSSDNMFITPFLITHVIIMYNFYYFTYWYKCDGVRYQAQSTRRNHHHHHFVSSCCCLVLRPGRCMIHFQGCTELNPLTWGEHHASSLHGVFLLTFLWMQFEELQVKYGNFHINFSHL